MRIGCSLAQGALLYVVLSSGLHVPIAALAAQPAQVGDPHAREVLLMHRLIRPDFLAGLNVWDTRFAEWRAGKPDELAADRAPLLLLHFWAPWCKPCIAELPIWRDLGPRLQALHQGKLRILYIALQTNQADMERFVVINKDSMPPGPWFLDVGERLAKGLQKGLPEDRLPLPVTVWLDNQRVVRQALVGSIAHRRGEVAESTARLIELMAQLNNGLTPNKRVPAPAGRHD